MDAHDALMDARSEARYETNPFAEPDTREVAETAMRLGAPVSVPDGTGDRG